MRVGGEFCPGAAVAVTWKLGLVGFVFKVLQIFDVEKLMDRLNEAA